MGQVWCSSCHGRAQHDRTPLNLPSDTWSVCQRCHTFTDQALAAGVGPCSDCHDQTQHRAAYRVDDCTSCHAGKAPHQNVVACASCHINRGPGHHKAGRVGARECSECHLEVEVHASSVGSPIAMTCGTCHDGTIHGVFAPVGSSDCITCHESGTRHSDGFRCTDCHWPAVHESLPNPGVYGAFAPLPLQLPEGDGGPDEDETPPPRDEFTDTGADAVALATVAVLLLLAGTAIRLGEGRRSRRGRS